MSSGPPKQNPGHPLFLLYVGIRLHVENWIGPDNWIGLGRMSSMAQ